MTSYKSHISESKNTLILSKQGFSNKWSSFINVFPSIHRICQCLYKLPILQLDSLCYFVFCGSWCFVWFCYFHVNIPCLPEILCLASHNVCLLEYTNTCHPVTAQKMYTDNLVTFESAPCARSHLQFLTHRYLSTSFSLIPSAFYCSCLLLFLWKLVNKTSIKIEVRGQKGEL